VSGKDVNDFICNSCILGKGKRLPAPSIPIDNRSQQPLSIVHIDLWGPATTPSIGGCRYFITCYDDCTRKIHLSFLKQKSDAFTAMMMQELSVNSLARSNPSDQIMAVNSTRQHGTPTCNLAALNTSKFHLQHMQNGRVERVHLTILNGRSNRAGTLRSWRTVLGRSCKLHCIYSQPNALRTSVPDDSWQNKESRLDHLQPFGCQVFYRDHRNPKLAPRYKEGLLMGFVDNTHNYRIWDTKSNSVITSRDVVFTHHSTTSDCSRRRTRNCASTRRRYY